ncbi:MAG: hypothetical protein ACP5M7_09330 [Thermoproteota archaeon]
MKKSEKKNVRILSEKRSNLIFMLLVLVFFVSFLFSSTMITHDPQDIASETSLDGSVFVSVYGNYEQYSAYYEETGHLVSSNNVLTRYFFAVYYISSWGELVSLDGVCSSFWGYDSRSYYFYNPITPLAQSKAEGEYAPVPVNAKAECWIGPPGST